MNNYKQIIKALHEAKTGPISDMDEIVKQYSKSANYKRNLNKIESLISEAEKIYKKIEEIAKETDYFKEDSEYKKLVEDLYKKYFDIFDLADKSQIFIGMYDEKNKEIINYNDYITVVYQPGLVGKGRKPTEKFLPRYFVTMQSVESPDIPMYKRLWNSITTGINNLFASLFVFFDSLFDFVKNRSTDLLRSYTLRRLELFNCTISTHLLYFNFVVLSLLVNCSFFCFIEKITGKRGCLPVILVLFN